MCMYPCRELCADMERAAAGHGASLLRLAMGRAYKARRMFLHSAVLSINSAIYRLRHSSPNYKFEHCILRGVCTLTADWI